MGCFIIAEAGVNHGGQENLAFALIDAAAAAGADAVKFQTFEAEKLVVPGVEKLTYQKANTGKGDQFSMLKSLELRADTYARLAAHCSACNIEFLSTPFDEGSADTLLNLGMKRIKVPSGEITNFPLLRYLASKDLPILLSTGMSTLEEVKEAVAVISQERMQCDFRDPLSQKLIVLHCTSNYPAEMEDANLHAIVTLREELGLPTGFSDHTRGASASLAAVALGAVVVEKHFTLDRSLPGPDQNASLTPQELARMIMDIRAVEQALGDGIKQPTPRELPVRDLVRRSVVVKRPLQEGQQIGPDDLTLLRPGTGISPKELPSVVGSRAARSLAAGHVLQWHDVVR